MRGKRTKPEKERDLRDIARWHVMRQTHQEIADRISADPDRPYTLSRVQITMDIKAIHEHWRREYTKSRDVLIRQELVKLQAVEDEYWAAWQRSCEEATETTTFRERKAGTGDAANLDAGGKDRAVVKRWEQVGDPRFLAGVERCQVRRMVILGIEEPPKAPIDPKGNVMPAVLILPDNGFNLPIPDASSD